MLSLQTNASALSTMNSLGATNKALGSSMTKLGTGYRVNSAMDDAAGLQIATRLNAQSRGMQVAQKNAQNSISMLQTAEGAMSEVNNMLLRMKDLATESANGTSSDDDKAAMQSEYDALGEEIHNILSNTSFAGSKLFADNKKMGGALGNTTGITFQVGATKEETVTFKPAGTGGSLASLITKVGGISSKIDIAVSGVDLTAAKKAINDNLDTKDLDDLTKHEDLKSGYDKTKFGATEDEQKTNFDAALKELKEERFAKQVAAIEALGKTTATEIDALTQAGITSVTWGSTTSGPTNFAAAIKKAKENLTAAPPVNGEISGANANQTIEDLTNAIAAVGTFRSDLGAVANRLEHTYNNLGNMIANTDTAKGRIMDTDFAAESSNMTKNQMLMQVSTAMLKQSNSLSQMVGSLVQ